MSPRSRNGRLRQGDRLDTSHAGSGDTARIAPGADIAPDTAVTGQVITARVREIIEHERLADEAAAASDAHRWEAAQRIAAELADGKSQRQLAAEIGKSQTHVSFMARAWRDYHGNQVRPPFAEAYQALKAGPAPAALESPETHPAMTRADAERRTGEIRAALAECWDEVAAAILAGVPHLMIVGRIMADWREFELSGVMGADDFAAVRRALVDPQIDALLAAAAAGGAA